MLGGWCVRFTCSCGCRYPAYLGECRSSGHTHSHTITHSPGRLRAARWQLQGKSCRDTAAGTHRRLGSCSTLKTCPTVGVYPCVAAGWVVINLTSVPGHLSSHHITPSTPAQRVITWQRVPSPGTWHNSTSLLAEPAMLELGPSLLAGSLWAECGGCMGRVCVAQEVEQERDEAVQALDSRSRQLERQQRQWALERQSLEVSWLAPGAARQGSIQARAARQARGQAGGMTPEVYRTSAKEGEQGRPGVRMGCAQARCATGGKIREGRVWKSREGMRGAATLSMRTPTSPGSCS